MTDVVDGAVGFEAFYLGVWNRVVGSVRGLGLGPEDAEDVAIDALAVACDRWSRVRTMEYPEAWTVKVAVHLALRRIRRRRTTDLDLDRVAPTLPADTGLDDRLAVRVALTELPRRQREVVALRYLLDRPEVEVAAVLGVSVGSVKQHASRGLATLRRTLRSDTSDPVGGRPVTGLRTDDCPGGPR